MARGTAGPETGEVGESCVLCTARAELPLLRTALLLSCLESQGKLEPMSSQSGEDSRAGRGRDPEREHRYRDSP